MKLNLSIYFIMRASNVCHNLREDHDPAFFEIRGIPSPTASFARSLYCSAAVTAVETIQTAFACLTAQPTTTQCGQTSGQTAPLLLWLSLWWWRARGIVHLFIRVVSLVSQPNQRRSVMFATYLLLWRWVLSRRWAIIALLLLRVGHVV